MGAPEETLKVPEGDRREAITLTNRKKDSAFRQGLFLNLTDNCRRKRRCYRSKMSYRSGTASAGAKP